MKKFDLLIFDADRTLFDFDKAERQAINKICLDINIVFTKEVYSHYQTINHRFWDDFEKGLINQDIIKAERFKEFFEYLGIDEDYIYYGDQYLTYLSEGNFLLPNAVELIQSLYNQYELVLLTNGLSKVQIPRFNNSLLKPYFRFMVVSEEVGVQKPDKKIFDIIFEKIKNVDLNRTLIIGDSLTSDIQGGKNAKIRTCWYNIGRKKNISQDVADYTIEELPDLYKILGE